MKKLLSLFISLAILALIYWKIGPENREQLLAIFVNCDRAWMACSLHVFDFSGWSRKD